MPAYLFSIPAAIPGQISRGQATVEPSQIDPTTTPAAFGLPVVLDATSHKVRSFKSSDSASSMFGFLVRSYPTESSLNDFGAGVPVANALGDVLKRGYIGVQVNGPTAAVKGGTVYVRIADADSTGRPIGGIEAAADTTGGTNTVALSNAYFTGVSDASTGVAEVAFNL